MRGWYVLNEAREAVPADRDAAGEFFDDIDRRRVGRTEVGPYTISTVFIGLDHGFGDGPPMLFETLVFAPDENDGDMERCSTWAQAEAMHAAFVARYRAKADAGETN